MKKYIYIASLIFLIGFITTSCREKTPEEKIIEQMENQGAEIKVKDDGEKIKMETEDTKVKIKKDDGETDIKIKQEEK
ncbi:hypothetical protein [uncultured Dokdonia sp.]|uniref:hypothetical protein n=1 Tax=uncultured Dokdonia sp. TaxID=575653 RepID=UPI00260F3559|nr:hypothetical protein [uncultured Dokdonia sp.]